MSHSHFPVLNAILCQLLAELEQYEAHIERLGRDWQARQDVMLFGEPGKSMDRMRMLAVAIPELSAHWLMLMISHTELMHNLWRMTKGEPLDLAAEVGEHIAAVTGLSARCRRLLLQAGPVLH